jgi:hypothetical protein
MENAVALPAMPFDSGAIGENQGGMNYDGDILDDFDPRRRKVAPSVAAEIGMLVEDRSSGFFGDVVKLSHEAVTLRDRKQQQRHFAWKEAGFLIDGQPVTLVRPTVQSAGPRLTNSGSVAVGVARAKSAQPSRIWVEGRHDAELLEHVWGDDLRDLGLVVEPMHGLDNIAAAVEAFGPHPAKRLGVLVDHLVDRSKESRLTASIADPNVLITGHPFVDVWAGIRPKVFGLAEWPDIPRGQDWKEGMCRALGTSIEGFWPRLRNKVTTYADLRPELVGAVERLIDFVAEAE